MRLLLAGQATSELGSQVGSIALPLVAVVALVVGAARVLFDVAYPSYLPALVGRDDLVRADAYLESSRSATQLAGPGLGGWLVQLAGAATAVAADAVSFLASAGCLLAIRAAEPRPARSGRRDLRRELAEGLRFVLAQPALLAALAATRVARGADTARLIWLPVTVTAPFALCTPLTAPGWRVALLPLGVAVTSFGQALYNVAQISYRQALCPPELLGRMNASIRFLVFGALPLGGLLGGLAGERLGVHATLWLCGIGLAMTPIPLLASPLRRRASEVGPGRRQ